MNSDDYRQLAARAAIGKSNAISRRVPIMTLYSARHVMRCWTQGRLMAALRSGDAGRIAALTHDLERRCETDTERERPHADIRLHQ